MAIATRRGWRVAGVGAVRPVGPGVAGEPWSRCGVFAGVGRPPHWYGMGDSRKIVCPSG